MKRAQIVICGFGGQGIVFLTHVIAQAAIEEGADVLTAETHGMAQRGSAIESHVKIGSFNSSLVRRGHADVALVLDRGRTDDARSFVHDGGCCIVNAPDECDAAGLARQLGAPKATNLVLLGHAVAAAANLFPSPQSIRAALERLCRPDSLAANRAALEKGIESA